MTDRVTRIAVLGSTGSIGRSTLEVIHASGGRCRRLCSPPISNVELLLRAGRRFRPRGSWLPTQAAARQDWSAFARRDRSAVGAGGDRRAWPANRDVDMVVSAIVGSAGLQGTWAALEAGKTVALANKESLVVAGPLVTRLARRAGAGPAGRQRAQRGVSGLAGRAARGGAAGRADGQRGAVSHAHAGALGRRDRGRGPGPSHLGHGAEDHHRFGHADEQGPGDHRGPLAVRSDGRSRSPW